MAASETTVLHAGATLTRMLPYLRAKRALSYVTHRLGRAKHYDRIEVYRYVYYDMYVYFYHTCSCLGKQCTTPQPRQRGTLTRGGARRQLGFKVG